MGERSTRSTCQGVSPLVLRACCGSHLGICIDHTGDPQYGVPLGVVDLEHVYTIQKATIRLRRGIYPDPEQQRFHHIPPCVPSKGLFESQARGAASARGLFGVGSMVCQVNRNPALYPVVLLALTRGARRSELLAGRESAPAAYGRELL